MTATSPSSAITRYSACAPNGPSVYPNTRSPVRNEVTPFPAATTRPANSFPKTAALGRARPDTSGRMIHGLPDR